jgi:hypothetical protein
MNLPLGIVILGKSRVNPGRSRPWEQDQPNACLTEISGKEFGDD